MRKVLALVSVIICMSVLVGCEFDPFITAEYTMYNRLYNNVESGIVFTKEDIFTMLDHPRDYVDVEGNSIGYNYRFSEESDAELLGINIVQWNYECFKYYEEPDVYRLSFVFDETGKVIEVSLEEKSYF